MSTYEKTLPRPSRGRISTKLRKYILQAYLALDRCHRLDTPPQPGKSVSKSSSQTTAHLDNLTLYEMLCADAVFCPSCHHNHPRRTRPFSLADTWAIGRKPVSPWHTSTTPCKLDEERLVLARGDNGLWVDWWHLHLAMRQHRLGYGAGIPLSTLTLKRHVQDKWTHNVRALIDDHLMLHTVSSAPVADEARNLDGVSIFETAIPCCCSHIAGTMAFAESYRHAVRSWPLRSNYCSRLFRCLYCTSEYMIVRRTEDPFHVFVLRWMDLGRCLDPQERQWQDLVHQLGEPPSSESSWVTFRWAMQKKGKIAWSLKVELKQLLAEAFDAEFLLPSHPVQVAVQADWR